MAPARRRRVVPASNATLTLASARASARRVRPAWVGCATRRRVEPARPVTPLRECARRRRAAPAKAAMEPPASASPPATRAHVKSATRIPACANRIVDRANSVKPTAVRVSHCAASATCAMSTRMRASLPASSSIRTLDCVHRIARRATHVAAAPAAASICCTTRLTAGSVGTFAHLAQSVRMDSACRSRRLLTSIGTGGDSSPPVLGSRTWLPRCSNGHPSGDGLGEPDLPNA